MRIGLFTDTYRPSINGIVYVVESLKKHLELEGHEVYIFCPARSMRPSQQAKAFDEDEHIIRFPSIKGAFYDDYDTSLFFPPTVLARIRELDLDVIHFLTPGQIGIMGVYAAYKTDTPLIAQHCTDLRQYVEHYTDGALLPGLLALIGVLPFTVKMNLKDLRELAGVYKPRRGRVQWNIDLVETVVTLVYSKCDAVIALSRKSQHQLQSWQTDDYRYDVTLLPNGVTPIPRASSEAIAAFRAQYGINASAKVFGFVGRLGAEKNLDLLIDAFERIAATRDDVYLLFVGDFEYRETLEARAKATAHGERIVFAGALPREELASAYGAMDVFTFPSLTDTQGWVIHEAAQQSRPVILIDREVSEVVRDGENGYFADNDVDDLARKVLAIFSDETQAAAMGEASRVIEAEMSEVLQIKKLIELYHVARRRHAEKPPVKRIRDLITKP